jgi:pimeloyl-ACP methyl ester carboxylesterase
MSPANGAFTHLRHVRAPTLVACGEHTDAIPPRLAVRIVERLPHGRLDIFSRAGHFGPMEVPEHTAASIADFEDVTR